MTKITNSREWFYFQDIGHICWSQDGLIPSSRVIKLRFKISPKPSHWHPSPKPRPSKVRLETRLIKTSNTDVDISQRPKKKKKKNVWLSSTFFFFFFFFFWEGAGGRFFFGFLFWERAGGGFFFFFFFFKSKTKLHGIIASPNKGENKSTLPKKYLYTSTKTVLKCKQVETINLKKIFLKIKILKEKKWNSEN